MREQHSLDLTTEQKLWHQGYAVIGVDEAGMGPLAGPVVAAAVCILLPPQNSKFKTQSATLSHPAVRDECNDLLALGVADSKKLTPKKREHIFEALTAHPLVRWGAGRVDEKIIDRINILRAGLSAMRAAADELFKKYTFPVREQVYVYVDGRNIIPDIAVNQKSIIDGDAIIFSIAAASIIAKVTRDRIMTVYAKEYPQYQFEKHKGYGTALHFELIKKYGISPIHRRSFLKKYAH